MTKVAATIDGIEQPVFLNDWVEKAGLQQVADTNRDNRVDPDEGWAFIRQYIPTFHGGLWAEHLALNTISLDAAKLEASGDFEKAAQVYEESLKQLPTITTDPYDPKNPIHTHYAAGRSYLAWAQQKSQDDLPAAKVIYEKALGHFSWVVANDPRNWQAIKMQGLILLTLGKGDRAEELFRKSLEVANAEYAKDEEVKELERLISRAGKATDAEAPSKVDLADAFSVDDRERGKLGMGWFISYSPIGKTQEFEKNPSDENVVFEEKYISIKDPLANPLVSDSDSSSLLIQKMKEKNVTFAQVQAYRDGWPENRLWEYQPDPANPPTSKDYLEYAFGHYDQFQEDIEELFGDLSFNSSGELDADTQTRFTEELELGDTVIRENLKARGLVEGSDEFEKAYQAEWRKPENEALRGLRDILNPNTSLREKAMWTLRLNAMGHKKTAFDFAPNGEALPQDRAQAILELEASADASKKAFGLSEKAKDAKSAAECYFAAAAIARQDGNEFLARELITKGMAALQLLKNLPNEENLYRDGEALKKIGHGFRELGRFQEAVRVYGYAWIAGNHSMEIPKWINYSLKQIETSQQLGEDLNRYDELLSKQNAKTLSKSEATELILKQKERDMLKQVDALNFPGLNRVDWDDDLGVVVNTRKAIIQAFQEPIDLTKIAQLESDLEYLVYASTVMNLAEAGRRELLLPEPPPYVKEEINRTGSWRWVQVFYNQTDDIFMAQYSDWNAEKMNESISWVPAYQALLMKDPAKAKEFAEGMDVFRRAWLMGSDANPDLQPDIQDIASLKKAVEEVKAKVFSQPREVPPGSDPMDVSQLTFKPVFAEVLRIGQEKEIERDDVGWFRHGINESTQDLQANRGVLENLRLLKTEYVKVRQELTKTQDAAARGDKEAAARLPELTNKFNTLHSRVSEVRNSARDVLHSKAKKIQENLTKYDEHTKGWNLDGPYIPAGDKPHDHRPFKAERFGAAQSLEGLLANLETSLSDPAEDMDALVKHFEVLAGAEGVLLSSLVFADAARAKGWSPGTYKQQAGKNLSAKWEGNPEWDKHQEDYKKTLGLVLEINLGQFSYRLNEGGIDQILGVSDVYLHQTDAKMFQDLPTTLEEGISGEIMILTELKGQMSKDHLNIDEVNYLIWQYQQAKMELDHGHIEKSLALFKEATDSKRRIKVVKDFEKHNSQKFWREFALELVILAAATVLTMGLSSALAPVAFAARGARMASFGQRALLLAIEAPGLHLATTGIKAGLHYGYDIGRNPLKDHGGNWLSPLDHAWETVMLAGMLTVVGGASRAHQYLRLHNRVMADAGARALVEDAFQISQKYGRAILQQQYQLEIKAMSLGGRVGYKVGDWGFELFALQVHSNLRALGDVAYQGVVHGRSLKVSDQLAAANSAESMGHTFATVFGLKIAGFATHPATGWLTSAKTKTAAKNIQVDLYLKNYAAFQKRAGQFDNRLSQLKQDPNFDALTGKDLADAKTILAMGDKVFLPMMKKGKALDVTKLSPEKIQWLDMRRDLAQFVQYSEPKAEQAAAKPKAAPLKAMLNGLEALYMGWGRVLQRVGLGGVPGLLMVFNPARTAPLASHEAVDTATAIASMPREDKVLIANGWFDSIPLKFTAQDTITLKSSDMPVPSEFPWEVQLKFVRDPRDASVKVEASYKDGQGNFVPLTPNGLEFGSVITLGGVEFMLADFQPGFDGGNQIYLQQRADINGRLNYFTEGSGKDRFEKLLNDPAAGELHTKAQEFKKLHDQLNTDYQAYQKALLDNPQKMTTDIAFRKDMDAKWKQIESLFHQLKEADYYQFEAKYGDVLEKISHDTSDLDAKLSVIKTRSNSRIRRGRDKVYAEAVEGYIGEKLQNERLALEEKYKNQFISEKMDKAEAADKAYKKSWEDIREKAKQDPKLMAEADAHAKEIADKDPAFDFQFTYSTPVEMGLDNMNSFLRRPADVNWVSLKMDTPNIDAAKDVLKYLAGDNIEVETVIGPRGKTKLELSPDGKTARARLTVTEKLDPADINKGVKPRTYSIGVEFTFPEAQQVPVPKPKVDAKPKAAPAAKTSGDSKTTDQPKSSKKSNSQPTQGGAQAEPFLTADELAKESAANPVDPWAVQSIPVEKPKITGRSVDSAWPVMVTDALGRMVKQGMYLGSPSGTPGKYEGFKVIDIDTDRQSVTIAKVDPKNPKKVLPKSQLKVRGTSKSPLPEIFFHLGAEVNLVDPKGGKKKPMPPVVGPLGAGVLVGLSHMFSPDVANAAVDFANSVGSSNSTLYTVALGIGVLAAVLGGGKGGNNGGGGSLHVFQIPADKKLMRFGANGNRVDYTIDHPYISGEHFTIRPDGKGGFDIYNHSRNGTIVNGRAIETHGKINPGEVVSIRVDNDQLLPLFQFGERPMAVEDPAITLPDVQPAPKKGKTEVPVAKAEAAPKKPEIKKIENSQDHEAVGNVVNLDVANSAKGIKSGSTPDGAANFAVVATQGIGKSNNEDAAKIVMGRDGVAHIAIFDGMGGHGNGDVAAKLGVEAMQAEVARSGDPKKVLELANGAINHFNAVYNSKDPATYAPALKAARDYIANPVTPAVVKPGSGAVAVYATVTPVNGKRVVQFYNVGDSKGMVLRKDANKRWRWVYRTVEDNEPTHTVKAGIDYNGRRTLAEMISPDANIVRNSLGGSDRVRIDGTEKGEVPNANSTKQASSAKELGNGIVLEEGDLLILFSDGAKECFGKTQDMLDLIPSDATPDQAVKILTEETHARQNIYRQARYGELPQENYRLFKFQHQKKDLFIDGSGIVFEETSRNEATRVSKFIQEKGWMPDENTGLYSIEFKGENMEYYYIEGKKVYRVVDHYKIDNYSMAAYQAHTAVGDITIVDQPAAAAAKTGPSPTTTMPGLPPPPSPIKKPVIAGTVSGGFVGSNTEMPLTLNNISTDPKNPTVISIKGARGKNDTDRLTTEAGDQELVAIYRKGNRYILQYPSSEYEVPPREITLDGNVVPPTRTKELQGGLHYNVQVTPDGYNPIRLVINLPVIPQ